MQGQLLVMKPRPRARIVNDERSAARANDPVRSTRATRAAVPAQPILGPASPAATSTTPPELVTQASARASGRSHKTGGVARATKAGNADSVATNAINASGIANAASSSATPAGKALRADGEATRVRILEAAGELAAHAGFSATPSKAIAARAQVDQASINYHFGGRAGLHQAVLVEAHRRFVRLSDLQRLAASRASATEKLRLLIHELSTRAFNAQGWHGRVLLRELASPSPALAQALAVEAQPKLAVSLGILSEVAGIPLHEPALLRCALSVIAPFITLTLIGTGISVPMQAVVRDAAPKEMGEHLFRFALAGLQAVGRDWVLREGGHANGAGDVDKP